MITRHELPHLLSYSHYSTLGSLRGGFLTAFTLSLRHCSAPITRIDAKIPETIWQERQQIESTAEDGTAVLKSAILM